MRENISISAREVKFFLFTSMVFVVCESLSIELNNFFREIDIYGYQFLFNPSVIFFCIGFFVIDLVTEIYNASYANYFIFVKLISQLIFIGLGLFGVVAAGITDGQIASTFFLGPKTLIDAMIASIIGYKLTSKIMQLLKIKFEGRSLYARYLSSTFPGEVVFSLIFTFLSFSPGRNIFQTLNIFLDLVAVKFIFSALFSVFVVPITNLIKNYLRKEGMEEVKSIPFIVN
ncbi:MAG: hypothetical protein A3F10_05685 [Coxiella sp. RIFCSPHIGHO2_12_FULL_42_15]|nr:MAG: hypothetical protein A3F10_05685 [Coxiella sp. RIFCSPHIGHO2_12_FULL_42_15]